MIVLDDNKRIKSANDYFNELVKFWLDNEYCYEDNKYITDKIDKLKDTDIKDIINNVLEDEIMFDYIDTRVRKNIYDKLDNM